MNILFRVDSSVEIGSGHVARCLTLAGALKQEHKECSIFFVCRSVGGSLVDLIKANGYECLFLEYELEPFQNKTPYDWSDKRVDSDADATKNIITRFDSVDLLVVDHYGIDSRWSKQIKTFCKKTLVLDDLANRGHECDYLLDQTLNRAADDYIGKVPKNCELLLGSDFALLRPEFSKYRLEAKVRRECFETPKRVLVSVGGTDPLRMTEKVMLAISSVDNCSNLIVDVVLSSGAPNVESVRDLSKRVGYPCVVHVDSKDMANLMMVADISVGAGGTTSWERCCVGLPTLTIQTADNQKHVLRALKEAGAIHNIDMKQESFVEYLAELFTFYMENYVKLFEMSSNAFNVCDGLGAKRCINAIFR